MKKLKSTLTIGICCLLAGISISQEDNNNYKLTGIRMSSGILNVSSYQHDKGILTELSKKSELAKEMNNVKDDFEVGGNRYVYGNSHYVIDFSFGKESSKTLDYSFFGGLDYSEIRGTNFSMSREEMGRYDTLTSSSTGDEYYVDTTRYTSYYIQENAEQIGIRLGAQMNVNLSKRFMFRIGLGYNYRFSINPEMNISKTSSTSGTNNYDGYGNYYGASQSSEYSQQTEHYKTSLSSQMFYIPVGIELRLGKKENLLGRLSLLAEADGGIISINSSMTGKYSTTVFSGRLGLKLGL